MRVLLRFGILFGMSTSLHLEIIVGFVFFFFFFFWVINFHYVSLDFFLSLVEFICRGKVMEMLLDTPLGSCL